MKFVITLLFGVFCLGQATAQSHTREAEAASAQAAARAAAAAQARARQDQASAAAAAARAAGKAQARERDRQAAAALAAAQAAGEAQARESAAAARERLAESRRRMNEVIGQQQSVSSGLTSVEQTMQRQIASQARQQQASPLPADQRRKMEALRTEVRTGEKAMRDEADRMEQQLHALRRAQAAQADRGSSRAGNTPNLQQKMTEMRDAQARYKAEQEKLQRRQEDAAKKF